MQFKEIVYHKDYFVIFFRNWFISKIFTVSSRDKKFGKNEFKIDASKKSFCQTDNIDFSYVEACFFLKNP